MQNARVEGLGNNEELAIQYLVELHKIGYFQNVIRSMKLNIVDTLVGADTDSKQFTEQMNYYKFNIQFLTTLDIELQIENEARLEEQERNRS